MPLLMQNQGIVQRLPGDVALLKGTKAASLVTRVTGTPFSECGVEPRGLVQGTCLARQTRPEHRLLPSTVAPSCSMAPQVNLWLGGGMEARGPSVGTEPSSPATATAGGPGSPGEPASRAPQFPPGSRERRGGKTGILEPAS